MAQYKISGNLAVSENGFLFMPNTGESFTVNETGREIISLLKEGLSEEEIITRMTEKYDVDPETAQRDFDEFITMLRNLKLVEES
jgi:PqqD family protein of HPr-rel-A system